jgi:signal transduction histidine kinase
VRRAAPVLVAVGIAALLISYVAYTQRVVTELNRETNRTALMFARVFRALNDTSADRDPLGALLDLSQQIRDMGVPVIVTNANGDPTASANLPFGARLDDPRMRDRLREFAAGLDRQNPPVIEPGVGTVHYGNTPLVRWLRIIPAVQASVLALTLLAGIAMLRARGRADREKLWAGMARESAHQLGTPLSSLNGWIELLSEEASGGTAALALGHMRADLERLERVAHRFERIGRPPRRESVDVAALVDGVARYFRARVPTLAHSVVIQSERRAEPLVIQGDPVLLEWAVESLVKNAVDALAGRGGTVRIETDAAPESGALVRVADDGPGIPPELRRRIFQPGFSTKERGWGIGLSLARRIVEDSHDGTLTLVRSDGPGAVFEIILR